MRLISKCLGRVGWLVAGGEKCPMPRPDLTNQWVLAISSGISYLAFLLLLIIAIIALIKWLKV